MVHAGRGMHETATGSVITRTNLCKTRPREDLEECFAELGFVFWMTWDSTEFCRGMGELAFIPGLVEREISTRIDRIPFLPSFCTIRF